MKNKILKYLLLSSSLMVLFGACRKDSFKGTETGSSGKTYVWITEAPVKTQFLSAFSDIEPVTMFSVRRDAASSGDLKKAITVQLTDISSTYLAAYNTANGTDYSPIPTSVYTLPTSSDIATGGAYASATGITASATGLTLGFASGDFAKNVIFKIDGSKLDLSLQYAAAYAITSYDGASKKVGTDTILSVVAIKNQYDGAYTATGTFTDSAAPTITSAGIYPYTINLVTTGVSTVAFYDPANGYYHLINSGGTVSVYGEFCPVFNFDPATNKITSVVNYYGQPSPSRGRAARIDITGINALSGTPGTVGSVIQVKYIMTQGGADRTAFDETYTYIGPR
jgi:hypothetical protein